MFRTDMSIAFTTIGTFQVIQEKSYLPNILGIMGPLWSICGPIISKKKQNNFYMKMFPMF